VLHLFRVRGHREEAQIQMEMRCGLGPARNRVHVHVKGTWRRGVEPDLAARLFASLSQRGRGERATIRFLGMPAWLQPPTQLGVMHEAHSPARRIGDHRAAGEMGGKLIAGEGILEPVGEGPHLAQIVRLLPVLRLEAIQQPKQLFSSALQAAPLFKSRGAAN